MTQRRLLVPPPRRRDEHDDGDADALPEEGDPAYAPRQSFESLRLELLAGTFPVITRAIRTFRKPIDRWWPAPPPEPPSRRKAVALPTIPAITQRDIKTQLMPVVRERDPAEPAYELPVSVWLRPPVLLALALAAVAVIGGIAFLAWP